MTIEYIIPGTIFGVVLVLYWLIPAVMPYNLPFGVRIPAERRTDPVIARLRTEYRWGLILAALLVVLVAGVLTLQIPAFTAGIGAIFAALILFTLDYIIVHQRLARIKTQEDWYAGLRQAIVVDTQSYKERPRLSLAWLIVSLALLAAMVVIAILRYPVLPDRIPIHFGFNGAPNRWGNKASSLFLLPLSAIMTAILIVLARYLPRSAGPLDPANIEASRRDRRERTSFMRTLLLVVTAAFNATMLLVSLVVWQVLPPSGLFSWLIVLAGLLPVLVVLTALVAYASRRGGQEPGLVDRSGYAYRDDDRYWKGGMLYVNRDDPAIFVERRFGIGWTLNLGNPLGLLALLLIIAVPVVISIGSIMLAHAR